MLTTIFHFSGRVQQLFVRVIFLSGISDSVKLITVSHFVEQIPQQIRSHHLRGAEPSR
jgi:hypothetical protein